ncbi:hypothetical protein GN958_ATG02669 [Phytophthora infestans]|uniref:Uncharacterized protein n=1 Tax=Phytophthora infestans TaxID=4787 RepID=A0A8S9V3U6_PHYIN|nr:hypothetical protein GN958_ATG02669 [Phytophthora infestans]
MRATDESFTHNDITNASGINTLSGTTYTFKATHPPEATQGDLTTTQGATLSGSMGTMLNGKAGKCRRRKEREIYVKMGRHERASVVMLSSEEKYCYAKAAFESVIEHLAELSSPAFYAALECWRGIARDGISQSEACVSDI